MNDVVLLAPDAEFETEGLDAHGQCDFMIPLGEAADSGSRCCVRPKGHEMPHHLFALPNPESMTP